METLTLTQNHRPLYAVQPNKSHPRTSVRRVLYSRFCRWLDNATPKAMKKAVLRTSCVVLFCLLWAAPNFMAGVLLDVLQWNEYRIPTGIAVFLIGWNSKTIVRRVRRRKRTGNAHTYEGIPVDELASYLSEHGFKRDHAMRTLGIAKDKYEKMAGVFDDTQVCTRDANNGRILNPHLSREDLIRQLRNGFPLVFDDRSNEWVRKTSAYAGYLRDEAIREKKQREKTERLERRAAKAKREIAQAEGFHRRSLAVA